MVRLTVPDVVPGRIEAWTFTSEEQPGARPSETSGTPSVVSLADADTCTSATPCRLTQFPLRQVCEPPTGPGMARLSTDTPVAAEAIPGARTITPASAPAAGSARINIFRISFPFNKMVIKARVNRKLAWFYLCGFDRLGLRAIHFTVRRLPNLAAFYVAEI